jgi:thiol-disulfide isomerase/thioredoxin
MKIIMKNTLFSLALLFSGFVAVAQSQELPTTKVRDMGGKPISFNETIEKGKVTLISFWATWCIPCKQEIKNIKMKLEGWQKEADFNFMTVSIDDSRATAVVKTYAKSQGWSFPTYLDPNSDLKRSLNFQNVPFSMIVDQNGKVVYQHTGYEEGGEDDLFERIKVLVK